MLSRVNCHCCLPQSNYNNYYPDEDVDDVEAAKKQRKNSEMSEENNNNTNRDIGSKNEPMTNNSGNVSSTSQEQSTLTSTNLAAFDSSSMRSSTHSSTASSRTTTTDSDSDRYTRYRDVDAQSIVSHQSNSILLPLDENEENDQVGSRPLDSAPTETFTAGSSGQIAVGLRTKSATTSGVGSNEDNRRSSMETTTESATAAAANETTSQVGDMMRSMTTIERNERAPRNQQDDGDIEHEDNLDESEWPGANPNEEPDDEDEIVEEHPPRPRASSLPSRNNENQPSTISNTLETTASSTSAASQGSTEPLIQDDRPHSYSRLTRHIQAYFNVTTAGINNDTQVTLETTGNERGEEERPSATETAAVISRPKSSKFEPKSSLFGSLVSHCNLLTTGSRSIRKSPQSLRHLAELFGHFESYYGVMMSQPMEHYFDTKRPRTCRHHHHQKMQLTDDEDEEEVEDENEDDEMSSSKRMRQNSAAVAALDDNARNADNDDEDNGDDSECSSSDDVNSYDNSNNSLDETFTASRGGGQQFAPANNSNSSSLCDLSNYSAPDTTGATTSSRTGGKNALTNEFHLCALCSHILTEPITLICGCTFCKSCLAEYQSSMLAAGGQKPAQQSRQQVQQCPHSHDESMRKRKHDESTSSQPSPKSFRCFTCGNAHEHNSLESIKPNVIITKLVEKYWSSLLEIRHLRNDIRNYICHCIEHPQNDEANFDFDMFDSMLNSAYTLDPSNHLILADLFILNYFNECNQTCLKYAQMACDLRPNWAFGYYLKAVYYRYMGDLASMRKSLLTCLQIEPNVEPIRRKLHQMFLKSTNFSINKSKTTESSISSSSSKKMTTSAAKSTPKSKPKSTTASTSSSEVSGYHFERPPESINITSMKFDEEKKSDKPVQSLRESTLHFDYSKYVTVDSSAVKPSELECSLCYRLLYHPVTTPCGHTFCLKCLERALDHRSECPLCKHSLDEVVAERRQFVTQFLTRLIRTHYRAEHDERKRQHRDEMLELVGDENELPVFVCTLAMPFAPCPLHIYEPRYRLMIRRAIESGRRSFGMAMYSERTPYRYAEYGCVLDIQTCQFLRDGRSILTTVGNRRFRVVNSGTRDGYNVARVEWVKDVRVDDQAEKTELLQLHDEVYRLAHTWYSHIPQVQKDRIMEIYGVSELPLPEADIQTDNGPYWHWFLLNILPLDRDFQYKFLCKTSLKERLKQMKKILLVIMAPLRQLVANAAAAAANDATSTTSEENSDTNSATSSSPHLQRHNSLQETANPTTATNIGSDPNQPESTNEQQQQQQQGANQSDTSSSIAGSGGSFSPSSQSSASQPQ